MSTANWYLTVPPAMRISVSRVDDGSASDCGSLEGDYLLSIVEQSAEGCRWELSFSPIHDFSQIAIVAAEDPTTGKLEVRAYFEGTVAGPQWYSTVASLGQKFELPFDAVAAPVHLLSCHWPTSVLVMPMQTALPSRGHYVSAQPTQREIEETMAAAGPSCSSFDVASAPACPKCDPADANCGCGAPLSGLWCAGTPKQLTVKDFPGQAFTCQGVMCTGTIRIRIYGIRVALTPPGNASNTCTCFWYTTFQIEFLRMNIVCPGGVVCNPFSTYLNGGNLWPGRWIAPGGCIETYATWYLQNCVTDPTFTGFNMTKFLNVMGTVPPNCDGTLQTASCPAPANCPPLPAACP